MVQLSIYKNPYYTTLSNNNRIHLRVILPKRGTIIDENNKVLAELTPTYRCYIVAKNKQEFDEILKNLEEKLKKNITIVDEFYPKKPVLLKANISWQEMAIIEALDIEGVIIDSVYKRSYPDLEIMSSTLGYVSPATENDDKKFHHPFMCLGHGIGIEAYYDKKIRGEYGYVQEESDAKGRVVRTMHTIPSISGNVLKTNINLDLQKYIFSVLKEENIRSAGIVIMNAKTGEIKALVSYPSFDGNHFSEKIPPNMWQELLSHEDRPLFNKVAQGQYAPASTFKIVMAICGLENKVITRDSHVFCPGYFEYGGRRFHCWSWKKGGHGYVNFDKAIINSCDVFFYNMALKVKPNDLLNTCKKLGFGKKTGIDFMYEAKGLLPNGKSISDMLNLSIGQGQILTTLMQNVRMFSAIVNGGNLVTPRIVGQSTYKKDIGISKKTLQILNECLCGVVNTGGTASRYAFKTKNGKDGMLAKTGTIQVYEISKQARESGHINDKPYHLKDHALGVAGTPAENTEYVGVAIIEHGGFGHNACRILQKAFKFMNENNNMLS